MKKISALIASICVSLVVLEVFLRFYQPFGFRVKGKKIVLPTNTSIIHKNLPSTKLDPYVQYSRNAIGLRGENPRRDLMSI